MKKILTLYLFLWAFSLVAQSPLEQARPSNISDGINYLSNGSVVLSLLAPYKSNVYVLGDFNNWTISPAYLMKKDVVDNNHIYWWIELSGLDPTKEYAFQYLIDGSLRIADPYTEKVLDPIHDPYIDSATYPDLKKYPTGQSEIVSVLFPSHTSYIYQNTNFVRPAKEKLIIYELHLRDFVSTHRFKTLTDTLAYIKRLGINAIELMPINEFEGNSSWGYNPSFYFAVDKYYGPADELKKFVDKCHGEGIAVIIDLVLNHSYNSSPLVRMYSDGTKPTAQNPWYNSTCVSAYCWGNDFNHTSTETQYFVDRVAKHWLTTYHFDGIRFDFTQGFTQKAGENWSKDDSRISLLKRMSDQIWKIDPTAYVILEHWAENSEETILANYGCMLWGNLTHEFHEAAMAWNEGSISDFSWAYYGNRGWNNPALVTYMESHDEERVLYKNLTNGNTNGTTYSIKKLPTALDRSELTAAFLLTIPGPKMLWQFQELGYDFSIDYNERVGEKPIRWDYLNDVNRKDLYEDYQKLIKLRFTHAVFTSALTHVTQSLNNPNGLKKIILRHSEMNAVVIGNFGVTPELINPTFPTVGTWYDCFGTSNLSYNGTDPLSITLAPGEYRIYTSLDTRNNSAYKHVNTSMFVAGTFNTWNASSHPMQLVADNTCKISGVPLPAAQYAIKFTNASNWEGNDWGNANGASGTAALTTGGGSDILFSITKSATYTITFNENTLTYLIAEELTTSELMPLQEPPFSIYPNPSPHNTCTILNSKKSRIDNIQILDATGTIVCTHAIYASAPTIELPIDEPAGLYMIVITYSGGQYVVRWGKN